MRNKFLNILCLSFILIFTSGCSMFTNPSIAIIDSNTISYDESGNLTSDILSESSDKKGFIVTKRFVERFNAMIEIYGKDFTPKLVKDQGVSEVNKTEYYFITNQSMNYFLLLNDMRRMDNYNKQKERSK